MMSKFVQARFPHLQIPTGKQEDAPEKIDNSKVKLSSYCGVPSACCMCKICCCSFTCTCVTLTLWILCVFALLPKLQLSDLESSS